MLEEGQAVAPSPATKSDLRVVHTSVYLSSLHCPCQVAKVVEVAPVAFIPPCIISRVLLKPFRYHTGMFFSAFVSLSILKIARYQIWVSQCTWADQISIFIQPPQHNLWNTQKLWTIAYKNPESLFFHPRINLRVLSYLEASLYPLKYLKCMRPIPHWFISPH